MDELESTNSSSSLPQSLDPAGQGEFVRHLTGVQSSLFGYLVTLLGDANNADYVLQQANVVMWRRAGDFVAGTSFIAWARRVAYFQALAFLRDRKREQLVFDEETVHRLALCFDDDEEDEDFRRLALRHCMSQLPERQMRMLRQRYWEDESIRVIASTERKSESAVRMALMRIRNALVACLQERLGQQDGLLETGQGDES
jgi:RNA polymerase sigma-70 factor, ECF subfamily